MLPFVNTVHYSLSDVRVCIGIRYQNSNSVSRFLMSQVSVRIGSVI